MENLKAKYDAALIDDRIVGLEISTRPDCINEKIVKLLRSYTDRYYVCVELGLQTSNENTGNLINRGYTNQQFTNAVSLLNKYNIDAFRQCSRVFLELRVQTSVSIFSIFCCYLSFIFFVVGQ